MRKIYFHLNYKLVVAIIFLIEFFALYQLYAIEPNRDNRKSNSSVEQISLLLNAIERGQILEMVDLLGPERALIDAQDEKGRNALCCAIQHGHVDILKVLIGLGVQLEARDSQKRTALHWAAVSGHAEIIHILLDLGPIYIDAKNNKNQTALYLAALAGYESIVKVLLIKGAEYKSKEEEPPMHWHSSIVQNIFWWAYYNKPEDELIKQLKEAGARGDWKSWVMWTFISPLRYFIEKNYQIVAAAGGMGPTFVAIWRAWHRKQPLSN